MNDKEKIKIITVLMNHIHRYDDWKKALKELGLDNEMKEFDSVRDKLLSLGPFKEVEDGEEEESS